MCSVSVIISIIIHRKLDFRSFTVEMIFALKLEVANLFLFDPTLYKEHKVLTSIDIQEHYLFAKGKRSDASCKMLKYRLVDINEGGVMSEKTLVNPAETPVNSGKTPVNPEISAQRKGKKSIVENSIENEIKEKSSSSSCAREETSESNLNNLPIAEPTPTEQLPCRQAETSELSFDQRCEEYQKEALKDEEWLMSIRRMAGYDDAVLENLPKMMPYFKDHLISISQQQRIWNIRDFKEGFVNWWRCVGFLTEAELIEKLKAKKTPRRTGRIQTLEDMENLASRSLQKAMELKRGGTL